MAKVSNIEFILNGHPSNNPRAIDEIGIVAEWGEENSEQEMSITSLSFVLDEYSQIKDWITANSRFQGMPIQALVTDGNSSSGIFDGYLDLRSAIDKGGLEYQTDIFKLKGNQQINQRLDGISFDLLKSEGYITDDMYVYTPYIINYIPDGVQVLLISTTLFMMTKELVEGIKNLAMNTTDGWTGLIPDVVVGLAVESVKPGNIAKLVLIIIFEIAYLIAITVAIILLIKELIDQFFPRLRYHAGIKHLDMWKAISSYLGLEFKSETIFELEPWKSAVYMPFKDEKGTINKSGGTGHPQANDPVYTAGSYRRACERNFNARYKIRNGVLEFERRDYWADYSSFILPDVVTNQDERNNDLMTNANIDFKGFHKINFALDIQDQNTLDNFDGTSIVVSTQLNAVLDQDYLLTDDGEEIQLPWALGTRKDSLTFIEKLLKGLFRSVDLLTGFFGKGTNFVSVINNRIGALHLSSPMISVPKMLIVDASGRLQSNQRGLLNAETLWDNYWRINSFTTYNGKSNQYDLYEGVKIPFNLDDLLVLMDDNFFTNSDGRQGEIIRYTWNPELNFTIIDYKIQNTEFNGFNDTKYL